MTDCQRPFCFRPCVLFVGWLFPLFYIPSEPFWISEVGSAMRTIDWAVRAEPRAARYIARRIQYGFRKFEASHLSHFPFPSFPLAVIGFILR
jgi:hypothetical protein